jgi:hypothetical protein
MIIYVAEDAQITFGVGAMPTTTGKVDPKGAAPRDAWLPSNEAAVTLARGQRPTPKSLQFLV